MAAERHEQRFRAMGTDCHVVVLGGPSGAAFGAIDRVRELESRWSRFVPTSDVSRLNARPGQPVRIADDTAELLRRGIEAWSLTGGLFDPTVLGDVLRAGYDRDLAEVVAAPRHGSSDLGLGCAGIVLERDVDGWSAMLPRGTGFDPGGIGKGLAADLVTDELLALDVGGACVNLGGDVRVAGDGPSGDGWTVDVDHPHIADPVARIGLRRGAVATSTTLLRRWTDRRRAPHPRHRPAHRPADAHRRHARLGDRRALVAGRGPGDREHAARLARCFDLLDEPALAVDGTTHDGFPTGATGASERADLGTPRRRIVGSCWRQRLWGRPSRPRRPGGRPNWMLDLHRFLGGLAVIFVGVHVVGIVADSYVHFGPADLLEPFAASYRPAAVAWGIVAMYALVAVEATSLVRKHLPRRAWRMTHALSFPLFAFSTFHAFTAGTDTVAAWLQVTMAVVCAAVAVLTVVRIAGLADGGGPRRPLPVRPAASPPAA